MKEFKVETSEQIKAPPEKVWDFLCDWDRWPEWVEVMGEFSYRSDERAREGSVYREITIAEGESIETEWQIIKFQPPHLQVHEHRGPDIHIILTHKVEPDAAGTRHTIVTEFTVGESMEKMFVKADMEPGLKQTASNFKRMIEDQVGA